MLNTLKVPLHLCRGAHVREGLRWREPPAMPPIGTVQGKGLAMTFRKMDAGRKRDSAHPALHCQACCPSCCSCSVLRVCAMPRVICLLVEVVRRRGPTWGEGVVDSCIVESGMPGPVLSIAVRCLRGARSPASTRSARLPWCARAAPSSPACCVQEELTCPICLELFSPGTVTFQSCGHSLCRPCLSSLKTPNCPTCRTPFPTSIPQSAMPSTHPSRSVARCSPIATSRPWARPTCTRGRKWEGEGGQTKRHQQKDVLEGLTTTGRPPPPPVMYQNGRTPQEEGDTPSPPPLLPFQCLRLTAKFLLRPLWCQEDSRLKNFGAPSARTIGAPGRKGGPSQTPLSLPPFRPPPPTPRPK